MTPILLFGCDGQVGWQLQRSLSPLGTVTTVNRAQCDLASPEAIRSVIQAVAPKIIVNAAAYTAVDRAETEPELAQAINATAPGVMAEAAKKSGALLVHYSTDYVFDGSKQAPYVETDPTCPLSVYGRTKRDGEEAVAAAGCRALVFRTSWVFGARGHNFVKTILRLAGEGRALRIVDDQIGAPTPAALISDVTGQILAASRRGAQIEECRLYHLAAANPVSWCGFAREILRLAAATPGFEGLPVLESVTGIGTADYPLPAPRPANSRLDCGKLEHDFDLELPDWRPFLTRMLQLLALKKSNGY
ncbi:MAG: dTDP-4-dehydrorhamnose reductase [Betaproteobacteria bacterium]|nr:dTDP-4-dehydrorhamnose reductase [Betaproteobacteria bacterium]